MEKYIIAHFESLIFFTVGNEPLGLVEHGFHTINKEMKPKAYTISVNDLKVKSLKNLVFVRILSQIF